MGATEHGCKNGQAALLFKTPAGALTAMEKRQGQKMGERWIDVTLNQYKAWQDFGL